MGINSKIEWCDHTWNPWYGCAGDARKVIYWIAAAALTTVVTY